MIIKTGIEKRSKEKVLIINSEEEYYIYSLEKIGDGSDLEFIRNLSKDLLLEYYSIDEN